MLITQSACIKHYCLLKINKKYVSRKGIKIKDGKGIVNFWRLGWEKDSRIIAFEVVLRQSSCWNVTYSSRLTSNSSSSRKPTEDRFLFLYWLHTLKLQGRDACHWCLYLLHRFKRTPWHIVGALYWESLLCGFDLHLKEHFPLYSTWAKCLCILPYSIPTIA